MTKKPRSLFSARSAAIVGVMVFALFGFLKVSSFQGHRFADCTENIVFDHSLPLSHPINRCAAQESQGISWSSWFTGHSSSYQFHFIDLLELLSRIADSSEKTSHQ